MERAAALAVLRDAVAFLSTLGWPLPIEADSGNGFHAIFRIALAADDAARALVQNTLAALAAIFAPTGALPVKLDTGLYNAARITKLYGTLARKGDHTEARPHRRSALLSVPDTLGIVTAAQMQELIVVSGIQSATAAAPRTPYTGPRTGAITDLGAYLAQHGIAAREKRANSAARTWVLERCVWSPEHDDGAAFAMQFPSGAIVTRCHHDSCQGKTLADFRDAVEPGWRNGHQRVEGAHRVEDAHIRRHEHLLTTAERGAAPAAGLPEDAHMSIFNEHLLVLQQQFMDGPGGVGSVPVWPGLDGAAASATSAGWPPAGRGCARSSGRPGGAPRER
jgi:hypothetical protein